jgi:hypothetical protein
MKTMNLDTVECHESIAALTVAELARETVTISCK